MVVIYMGAHGKRVLLVEDDILVAMFVEEILNELGYELARDSRNVAEALIAVERGGFDIAILDVNIAGEKVYPVADALSAAGIPYIFSSGYGRASMPQPYASGLVVAKPYRLQDLESVLAQAAHAGEV
jgi:CheY-like chemotaxis protein